ncbi:MAG: tetratricopeptide repeat protein [Bacteroidota bacterium]
MKKFLLLFCIPLQILFSQSNNYDSLQQLVNSEKVPARKFALIEEQVDMAFGSDLHKALSYSREGIALSEKTGDKEWIPKFYEMTGRMHANLVNLDSASFYFDKAMPAYTVVNNKKGQATTLFKMAWVYRKKDDMENAMATDLKALRIMESINDKKGIASAYTRVTEDLTRQGRLQEALAYSKKSIAFCKENQFDNELIFAYSGAGDVSIAMQQDEQSLAYYDIAITLARKIDLDALSLTDFANSRGNALKHLGRYNEALQAYKAAMEVAVRINYTNAITAITANLGEVQLLSGNYAAALPYQLETVRLQEENHDYSNLVENYGHVSTIYEKLENYPLALEFQKKARKLRDSTASLESDAAMSKLMTQYETEKKEVIIASQGTQLSQQRMTQWLSIGIAGLLAGFLFFGFRSYNARTVTNKLLAAKNKENELLLKEIHHRVKNNLEVVSSLLALQSAQIDDQHTKDAMLEGQNRVQSIGIVHQKLYQGSNLGAIEMKDYFINLSDSILDSFGAAKRVTIECAMSQLDVDIDTAVPLGLIVNELLTNTLKYAFPSGQHGKVLIKLEKRNDGVLHLQISDDGIGKNGITHGTGFGGQLVSLLTQQLSGSMREEIKDGTHIYFEFKPSKAA